MLTQLYMRPLHYHRLAETLLPTSKNPQWTKTLRLSSLHFVSSIIAAYNYFHRQVYYIQYFTMQWK